MSNWQTNLRQKSYSQSFIWKSAITILLCGLSIGALVDLLTDSKAGQLRQDIALEFLNPNFPYSDNSLVKSSIAPTALITQLENEGITIEEFFIIGPYLYPYYQGELAKRIDGLLGGQFDTELASMLGDYLASFAGPEDPRRENLESKASQEFPPRYANRLLGEIEARNGYYHRAYPYFKREGQFPDARQSRERAVNMLLRNDKFDELQALLNNPAYEELISFRVRLDIATHKKDWLEVAKLLPFERFSNFDVPMAIIAGITAIVWAALLFRLGQISPWLGRTSYLCLLALFAGVLSTIPTVFLVIVEDTYVGYQPDGDLIRMLAFFIGGVGLREEFCKLLFFLPFAIYFAKQGEERDAFIVASFVGLGFAAEENIGYFSQSLALVAPGRFLTANFFHIALTGMGGLYLCRALRRSNYNDFFYIFGIMIVVHGLYNTLLSLPQSDVGPFFAMTVFILLSMHYFRELYSMCVRTVPTYSLSFLFVSGLCLILSGLIIFQASQIGLSTGLLLITPEVIGSVVIVFMFFREFNEALGA